MKNINKSNKGYSIVELLGVMVILGILLSMGMMAYTKYKKSSANKSYELMSKNAASAAEEYFMDHLGIKEVTIDTLVEKRYLEPTIDPMFKNKTCDGKVVIFDTKKDTTDDLEINSYKVEISCKKYKSCEIYSSDLECDSEDGGMITNGTTTSYSLGLENYEFHDAITIAIRVKFNEFTNNAMEYFGNWQSGGGGLGLSKSNHNFYVDFYSIGNGYIHATANVEAILNRWYVVVGVLDSGTLKLYIDGQLQASSPFPGEIKKSPVEMLVGGNPQPNGVLYLPVPITSTNALIFKRAVTQQEINNYFSTPNMPINYEISDPGLLVNKKF